MRLCAKLGMGPLHDDLTPPIHYITQPCRYPKNQPQVYTQLPSQSAPTILIYQVDLIFFQGLELKRIRSKIWTCKKQGAKKQGHCYSKREKADWPLLFLDNNDPIFCTLLFATRILDLIFFQGHKPTHVFKTRIVDAD